MADISKVTLPSGSEYNLKDAQARSDIEDIRSALSGGIHYIGVTTTALTDGSSTNPITIGGQSVTAKSGDLVIYGNLEFIFTSTDNKWHEFGSTGSLKSLAFKDSASGSYTPSGAVSTPTITIVPEVESIQPIDSVGTAPSCTLPDLSMTVANENLSFGWSAGSFDAGSVPTFGTSFNVMTGIDSATSSQPTFTGSAATITVS